MQRLLKLAGSKWRISACILFSALAAAQSANPPATIRHVGVLNHGKDFELEIETSQPITPHAQVITGPDRLVIDFPRAVPGPSLHAIAVNTAEVKGIRVGIFGSNPPTGRIVVDLNSPQPYQIYPSGRKVIVKIAAGMAAAPQPDQAAAAPGSTPPDSAAPASAPAAPAAPPEPVSRLQVDFIGGQLAIHAEHATLADVLRAVQHQTGATVTMPPAADHEIVSTDIGPAPPRQTLSALLNGAPFNILLIGSGPDISGVTSIVLTPRDPGATADMPANVPANAEPAPVQEATPEPPPEPEPPPPPPDNPPEPPPVTTPDMTQPPPQQ